MPAPIGPDAVYHLVTLGDPHLAPDGARVAAVRSWVDRATMESRSQVVVKALPGGALVPYTAGPRDTMPRFSPDGRYLAFLRGDAASHRQVWLLPLTGGEARQLTSAPQGVVEYAWSPDGSRLVYGADVAPDCPPADHNPKLDPQVRVVRRIRYRYDGLGWRGDTHRHLFVIPIQGGEARQVTDGDWDDLFPVWSPDGTRIAFISGRRPDRDVRTYTQAYVVPADGGEAQLWSADLYSVGTLAWSPDGTRLAAVASDDPDITIGWQGWVYVLEPGQPPRRLTDDAFRPATGFFPVTPPAELRWTADDGILFVGDARGQSYICRVPTAGGPVRTLAGGGLQLTTMATDAAAAYAAVAGAAPDTPGTVWLADLSTGLVERLDDEDQSFLHQHPPGHMEKLSVYRDGVELECRLWLPPDFDPNRRYPLVLDVHGGPNSAWYDAFNLVQQVLVTHGYAVLAVNPRGSTTYGKAFTQAVLGDWGGEDFLDLMAALDEVVVRPYIDPGRLAIYGYSYGGFMSSWAVGHTNRFKAAVVGAPCIDLPSMYGTSDIGVSFGETQWGGTRFEAEAAMRQRSPLTYAARVSTPVLLLHAEGDLRCPIEQSEQYFVALKRLGKEVEFVRFPGGSHQFLRIGHPRLREEYLRRVLEWLDRHVRAAVTAADGAATRAT